MNLSPKRKQGIWKGSSQHRPGTSNVTGHGSGNDTFSRRKSDDFTILLRPANRFNRATPGRCGGRSGSLQATATSVALIGPRLFSVENDRRDGVCDLIVIASMGPRLFSVENEYVRGRRTNLHKASMGPRLFSVENSGVYVYWDSVTYCFNGATLIQRGEQCCQSLTWEAAFWLQWGHAYSAWRTKWLKKLGDHGTGFNGATLIQRGERAVDY